MLRDVAGVFLVHYLVDGGFLVTGPSHDILVICRDVN